MAEYSVGEKVIARDTLGDNYESKILDVDTERSPPRFYVHYDGWNARWNEWITAERIMKLTEDNIRIANVKTKHAGGRRPKKQPRAEVEGEEEQEEDNEQADGDDEPVTSIFFFFHLPLMGGRRRGLAASGAWLRGASQ